MTTPDLGELFGIKLPTWLFSKYEKENVYCFYVEDDQYVWYILDETLYQADIDDMEVIK